MLYKTTHNAIKLSYIIASLVTCSAFAQMGIGTDKPEGMLDISNSNLTGIVFPKAALIASNVAAPVINPQGGSLAPGTLVFNTNSTTTGAKDVYPGIYAWDGAKWAPQFLLEDGQSFEQTTLPMRVVQSDGFVDVPGLGSGSSFTAEYTGTYRIKAVFNFGAGRILDPSTSDAIRMATQEGYFRFEFDGTQHNIYTHAYSLVNQELPGSDEYVEKFRHDSSLVLYEDLKAGETYNFRLRVDVQVSNNFVDDGNSGEGRAYVGIEIPCSVEFTFQQEK